MHAWVLHCITHTFEDQSAATPAVKFCDGRHFTSGSKGVLNGCMAGQAGQCGRCRAELGESGQVCRHCRLDERWLAWEMRLYSVHTRALVAGAAVSAEDALRQVQPHCRGRVDGSCHAYHQRSS